MASLGGGNKCVTCNKSVYSNEQISFEKKFYHTTCFVCSICKTVINSTSKAGSMDGTVSHRLCFEKQMKTSGGKYGGEKVVAGGKVNVEPTTPVAVPSPTAVVKPAAPPPAAAKPAPSPAVAKPALSPTAVKPGSPVAVAKPATPIAAVAKPAPVAVTSKPEMKSSQPAKPTPAPAPVATVAQKIAMANAVQAEQKSQSLSVVKKTTARGAAASTAVTPQELPIAEIQPSAEQLAHLEHVFQELDKEKSGYLSDLVGATKKAGFPVDEATATKLLKGWSGRFNFEEFYSAILPVLRLEHRNWNWVAQLPVNPEEDKGPAIPGRWKTVRVFLSSTFVDMHGERDCLINEVFPEINNRVKSHYVRVVPVDLRWGVSSEETSTIQSTCLNEIDHCRTKPNCLPWFVGLRGRRLGWVQTKYQPPTDFESPDKLKWVPPFWRSETPQSITSMEVYHAFVGAAPPADDIVRSLFVFRQDKFEKDCPDNMKWLFDFEYLPKEKEGTLDKEVQHQYAYVPQFSRYSQDYETLQKQIRDAPHPKAIFDYPCNFKEAKLTGQLPWGKKFGVGSVGALDEFRDFITNTLTESIQAEFPFPGELTPQERESAKHSALIEDRAEGFVGRTELLQSMLDYCQGRVSHNGAMVIVGEPGSGKSALMARFCEMYRALLQGNHSKTILISHLIGASEDSELVDKLLRRICQIVRDTATDEYFPSIPDDFESLKKDTWTIFVKKATDAGFRVVIVLDAVNQLRPLNNAHSMTWLPAELQDDCKIVISTLEFENDTYANLKQLHLSITEERVTPLDSADRQALVSALLAKYHKKLTCDSKDAFLGNQMEILLGKEQGTSPLYLVVACDVLRRFGVYEKLTEYLKSLPGTIPKLFEFVLADLEAQHGQALVRIVTSLLAVSRGGMSEIEILAILAGPEVQKELGETKSNFSQLYGPLRSFFSSGGEGYIRFFHDQLLYVVRARYTLQPGTQASIQTHRFLGLYFREVVLADLAGRPQATVGHAYGEVAYHLLHANLLPDLRKFFFTIDFNYRRIELFSIFALLDDFELYFSAATDGALKLLRAALQLATPILAQGPAELMLQLYLRLSQDVASQVDLAKLLDVQSDAWNSSIAQHKSGLLPVYDSGIVRPGTVLSRLQGANATMTTVGQFDQGRKFLTSQANGQVTLWDLASGKPLVSFNAHKKLAEAKISPDASSLLTLGFTAAESDVQMKLWNLRKPQPTCVSFSGGSDLQIAKGFAINANWDQAVTWHEDSSLVFWNLKTPDAPPHIAKHPKFYDNFVRMKAAEKVIEKREADRKTARAKKQAARGGEAHSSDESQGDEDDGIAVDYWYSVGDCKLFSQIAVSWSDGEDGSVCVWNNKLKEPVATFEGAENDCGPQGGRVLGEESKNGPCLATWTMEGLQTWNFNDLKDPKGEYLKLDGIEKVVFNETPNQLIVMTDDEVKVLEFVLPAAGKTQKIGLKVLSGFKMKKEKGSSSTIVDVVSMADGLSAAFTSSGELLVHKAGDGENFSETQLVWGSDVNIALEKKKEKESKNDYSMAQGVGCNWTGERILARWSNGMLTLWHPTSKKSNYLFVDTNESQGLELLPAPGTSNLTRLAMWDRGGLTSYVDLTHEGVQANKGNEAGEIRAVAVPLTYARNLVPMKNSIFKDSLYPTKDGQRIVAFDSLTGDSCVFHLSGVYAATTLDAGPSSNMYAGLIDDNTYISSHFSGVCLWDLAALTPNVTNTVAPNKKHRLLKHRTKKDPGELKISRRVVLNMGSKLTTVYEIPSGKTKILKSEEDMFGALITGETQALQWGEHTIYLWNIATEPCTCVPLKGHTRNINDVYVSEDFKYALSTSDDCSVRVWDLATQASTVLIGVHNGVAKAKFLPGKDLRVITWGKREACLWTLKNNAVVNKITLTPPGDWDDDDQVYDVVILEGPVLALVCRGAGCSFFDVRQPNAPDTSHFRFNTLYPVTSNPEFKEGGGGARAVGCATNGAMTLYTVRFTDGALDVRTRRLHGHDSEAEVTAISNSLDFLSYGKKDKKVVYWNSDAENVWSMTFGYTITSLQVQYEEVSSRLSTFFVHMDGGNFALFKPKADVQADYANAREALIKQGLEEEKNAMSELDALLASLNEPTAAAAPEFEMDPELAALLKSLEDPPAKEPEMDPELAALLKSLE